LKYFKSHTNITLQLLIDVQYYSQEYLYIIGKEEEEEHLCSLHLRFCWVLGVCYKINNTC